MGENQVGGEEENIEKETKIETETKAASGAKVKVEGANESKSGAASEEELVQKEVYALKYMDDGRHPNLEGHKLWLKCWGPQIEAAVKKMMEKGLVHETKPETEAERSKRLEEEAKAEKKRQQEEKDKQRAAEKARGESLTKLTQQDLENDGDDGVFLGWGRPPKKFWVIAKEEADRKAAEAEAARLAKLEADRLAYEAWLAAQTTTVTTTTTTTNTEPCILWIDPWYEIEVWYDWWTGVYYYTIYFYEGYCWEKRIFEIVYDFCMEYPNDCWILVAIVQQRLNEIQQQLDYYGYKKKKVNNQ